MGQRRDKIRVCIVDDHEVVRDGIKWLMDGDGGFEVVGEADDAHTGLGMILDRQPDVAVIDAKLPGREGISLVRSVRSRDPGILCLILTSFPGRELLHEAVLAGASGFVSKDVPGRVLLGAIRKVADGGSVLDWNLVTFDGVVAQPDPGPADLVAALTAQERRILDLLAEGCTNQEIADVLFLSARTVRNYVSTLLGKLGVKNRTQAAMLLVSQRAEPAASFASRAPGGDRGHGSWPDSMRGRGAS